MSANIVVIGGIDYRLFICPECGVAQAYVEAVVEARRVSRRPLFCQSGHEFTVPKEGSLLADMEARALKAEKEAVDYKLHFERRVVSEKCLRMEIEYFQKVVARLRKKLRERGRR